MEQTIGKIINDIRFLPPEREYRFQNFGDDGIYIRISKFDGSFVLSAHKGKNYLQSSVTGLNEMEYILKKLFTCTSGDLKEIEDNFKKLKNMGGYTSPHIVPDIYFEF